jgi:hypothetical protein
MINWAYMIASMLVSAKANADAEKKGNTQRRLAGVRKDAEQDKIDAIMNKNFEQYMNPQEEQAMAQIIADKVAPATESIDSTTNFQDVDRFGAKGSTENTAYQDALTGAISKVAEKAKTKAGMLANVKAPTQMRQDQSMSTADAIQRQGVIGKKANDWYKNVSQLEIENAYKPSATLTLLSKALGAYATAGGGTGADNIANGSITGSPMAGRFTEMVNGIPVVDATAMNNYQQGLNFFGNTNLGSGAGAMFK